MASWALTSIVLLSVSLTLVASFELGARKEECPPGNPFCNIWVACNFNESIASAQMSCRDCNTRIMCTPLGGFIVPCWVSGHHNCVNGYCVTEPSEECASGEDSSEDAHRDWEDQGVLTN